MKTGTDVHKAIDMSVVMCLSENVHYQLSNLSPPTADGGAGVRHTGGGKARCPSSQKQG